MQAQKYAIKHLKNDERPREKLLSRGPEALSDSELIALLIAHGNREKSALDLARDLLELGKNNLGDLGKCTVREMTRVNGIGTAKAIGIVAAMELGRRRQAAGARQKESVTSSRDVAVYLQTLLRDYRHEVFAVLYLNRANKVNHFGILSEGGITGTVADPRRILRKALEEDAVSLILCHNHPSGNLHPSRADEELTLKIREAARFFDIKLLDHIIVSDDGYFSFADEGLL
jgi:DNA repair protein RadC